LAYAAESNIYRAFWRDNVLDPEEARSRGKAAALKALDLDKTLAEAHSALAYIKRYEWDWSGAESEFKRAIELNPNLSSARNAHSFQLSAMGRHEEALAENKRAQELERSRMAFRYDEGLLLLLARSYDESIQHGRNMMGVEPDSIGAETNLGRAYAAKGMYTEAITALQKAVSLAGERTDLDPSRTDLQCFLGNAFALSGKRDEALAILHKLKAMKEYVSPALIATIYAGLGEKEEAFHSLEKAYAAHDLELRYVGTDPAYDKLRADPRFTDLLRRVGLLP
jgi:adenylate cyclase